MMVWKPPTLTRIYILGEPQCWIYAVKASGIHVYDRQIMEWYHHTMLLHTDNIKPDQKGRSLSNGLDKPHHSWAPSTCTACMVWGKETPYETDWNMDQVTTLFEFLQHISFPQPSHFAFRLICGTNFFCWNTSLLMTALSGILWSPYWISGHVNFECILSAQVNRSHSRTWNYTQR